MASVNGVVQKLREFARKKRFINQEEFDELVKRVDAEECSDQERAGDSR